MARPAPRRRSAAGVRDEIECQAHFGPAYAAYMQTSKRFIPRVF